MLRRRGRRVHVRVWAHDVECWRLDVLGRLNAIREHGGRRDLRRHVADCAHHGRVDAADGSHVDLPAVGLNDMLLLLLRVLLMLELLVLMVEGVLEHRAGLLLGYSLGMGLGLSLGHCLSLLLLLLLGV